MFKWARRNQACADASSCGVIGLCEAASSTTENQQAIAATGRTGNSKRGISTSLYSVHRFPKTLTGAISLVLSQFRTENRFTLFLEML